MYSRESISQRSLKEYCGIESLLSRDLAMYLEKDSTFDPEKCLIHKGIKLYAGKMVGITVRSYRFQGKQNADELYKNYKNSVSNFIIWLTKNDYHPVLNIVKNANYASYVTEHFLQNRYPCKCESIHASNVIIDCNGMEYRQLIEALGLEMDRTLRS